MDSSSTFLTRPLDDFPTGSPGDLSYYSPGMDLGSAFSSSVSLHDSVDDTERNRAFETRGTREEFYRPNVRGSPDASPAAHRNARAVPIPASSNGRRARGRSSRHSGTGAEVFRLSGSSAGSGNDAREGSSNPNSDPNSTGSSEYYHLSQELDYGNSSETNGMTPLSTPVQRMATTVKKLCEQAGARITNFSSNPNVRTPSSTHSGPRAGNTHEDARSGVRAQNSHARGAVRVSHMSPPTPFSSDLDGHLANGRTRDVRPSPSPTFSLSDSRIMTDTRPSLADSISPTRLFQDLDETTDNTVSPAHARRKNADAGKRAGAKANDAQLGSMIARCRQDCELESVRSRSHNSQQGTADDAAAAGFTESTTAAFKTVSNKKLLDRLDQFSQLQKQLYETMPR